MQASYIARLAACSKQIQSTVKNQMGKLSDTFKNRDMNNLKQQLNDVFKDASQSEKSEFVHSQRIQYSQGKPTRQSIHSAKAGMFGKAESVVIENIQINNHGSKSWAECCFEWLKNGGQKRIAATSLVVGAAGGYALGSYNNKQPVQPQIIVAQVPSSQQ